MKRTSIIPIRLVEANHDIDWDGVPNRLDCDIWNPHKQGLLHKQREKPSGLRYKIIEGKNDYCAVIDRQKNWKTVFHGTIHQCQTWVTGQYKMML